MPNINLTTESVAKEKGFSAGMGMISLLVAVLIFAGVYGYLYYTKSSLAKVITLTQTEYNSEYAKFLSESGSEVIDFKNRSDIAKKLIKEDKSMSEVLTNIEKSILPAVYLDSFSYNETNKTITLECIGDSFETVSKQIASLKGNEYFSAVVFGESSLNDAVKDSNKVRFALDFIINNK
jgi:Tfp pilus assembly protein PilN